MGKIFSAVRACVNALQTFKSIDSRNIFVLGKTLGGSTGLIAAAHDERIAGIAAVAAFSPWRSSNHQYESFRNFSYLRGLIPRLGWYAEKPEKRTIDWDEIISCIALRPSMLIPPSRDR